MYLVGGVGNRNIDKYDSETKSFVTVKAMDTERSQFGICFFNKDNIIVAGGLIRGERTKTAFLYNTRYNSITKISDLNEEKYGHVLVNCLGTVFAIGDFTCEVTTSIEKYNPELEVWQKLPTNLQVPRYDARAVAHNEFIYVFGGRNVYQNLENSIERLNVTTGEVTIIDSRMLVGRNCPALCKIDSDVYILGGDVFVNYEDLSNDEESDMVSRANKKRKLSTCELQRVVLNHTNHFTDCVEIFNLDDEEITGGRRLPIADEGFSAVVLEN